MSELTLREMFTTALTATVLPEQTPPPINGRDQEYVDLKITASVEACHLCAFLYEEAIKGNEIEEEINGEQALEEKEKSELSEKLFQNNLVLSALMSAFVVVIMQSTDIPMHEFSIISLTSDWHVCVLKKEFMASSLAAPEGKETVAQDFADLALPAGVLLN